MRAAQATAVGQGEHQPESNIVDIIPNGGGAFPECFVFVFQDCLEGTGRVMNGMI